MKIAPILRSLDRYTEVKTSLIHTGQHYDHNLSDVFFEDLGIRRPDVSLGVGSGSHAAQTAEVMVAIERWIETSATDGQPVDQMVVVGDVNSTMAAAIAATKLHVPVAHVEAGLRSFDRRMPEEINRLVTDSISTQLFCSEPAGIENLSREGHPPERLHLVGNVMIDTLLQHLPAAQKRSTLQSLGLSVGQYGVITMHRPSNVDDAEILSALLKVLVEMSSQLPMIFPVHPRTKSRIEQFGLSPILDRCDSIHLVDPMGYLDFLALTSQAKVIVTDSGGLQEESTALGVPCLTMRENTERPITVDSGSGVLIGNSADQLQQQLQQVLTGNYDVGHCPELWDGHAADRIAKQLVANH
ncbi:UDP-2,3-diacetamido-2,3-dideoxy-D-glucuronate 2-epimerase [Rubripirellula lacrimiformis]|uniref:UDP-2,3-diacetamido-2,3-dideoxy-D-glucuronate 2-epimerase n=2 Tax=Rubripirellula lacrimiformis TaxID=1930273 RepID=A0A517NGL6_9BACT|nr:UDP-2,3-diacetamido-2,3-dideoxy-D-glucuronate 2-epimerase [Rubripirellula lacrimiformis]